MYMSKNIMIIWIEILWGNQYKFPGEHYELIVNCVSPFKVKRNSSKSKNFMCFSMIDPATGWFDKETKQFLSEIISKNN